MGWFYSGVRHLALYLYRPSVHQQLTCQALLGPALSPVIAGIFTQYTAVSPALAPLITGGLSDGT